MKKVFRLDKYLADMGAGTRTEVKNKIRKGLVSVNGNIVTSPELKVDTESDEIICDGETIGYVHYEYYMLNKPAGVLSATQDKHAATVVDLIDTKKRKDLFPVGRLDKDTEGLLLLTNDGALTHSLLSPKKHVSKIYYAKIDGCVTPDDVKMFSEGLLVDDELTAMPARLTILSADAEKNMSEILIEICEGKFHQVKRMFEAVGKEVAYLKRLSMGNLHLDPSLTPGEYRSLTQDELEKLKESSPVSLSDNSIPEMMDQVKSVIFDLDGTLVDSMWLWRDIDIEYLGRFGVDMPKTLQDDIAGISVTETALYFKETFHIDDPIEKIIADWNKMAMDKYSHKVPLKGGAKEFIQWLHHQGISCAIATSNSRALAEAVLNNHDMLDAFEVILTGEDVHKGKPEPDVYLEAAKRLGTRPKHCLVFEDIPHGLTAAVRAGMRCVAVEDDYSKADEAKKRELADYYIRDYIDIFNRTYEELK